MKIAYCINSIRGLGGIQKVTISKVNALAEIPDNELYVIVSDNWMSHKLLLPLSRKVHFVNLKIDYYRNDHKSKVKQILSNLKVFNHWVKLQQAINIIRPDVIVSVGQSEKYILPLLWTKAVKIREIHFASNYREYTYQSRFKARILNFLDYKLAAKGYSKVVLLTKEDKETYFPKNDKFIFINNPLTSPIRVADSNENRSKKVITVGRLNKEKDYASLIRSWNYVCRKNDDWSLYIIGEGPERKHLEQEISDLKLTDRVFLPGYSNQVDALLSDASIFVMTSMFEGFGLVILEAMNAGLPVISYTCQFGPKDIIKEGVNGFLIENRDEKGMGDKICELIQDKDLRKCMSQAASKRALDFSLSETMKKWMSLFEAEIASNKRTTR